MNTRPVQLGSTCFIREAFLWALIPIVALILISPSIGDAQVETNITQTTGAGDLGTQVLPPSGNVHGITGGTTLGPNLFHSFGQFNVGAGDIARFQTPNLSLDDSISNILGRVTGGNPSNIFGTLDSATFYPHANLYLMNPFGTVFGPTGSLDVGGSVGFTTAQYVRLSDGVTSANFYANPVNDSLANSILVMDPVANFGFLSSANPVGYGFLTAPDPTTTIRVQGSAFSVPSGQSISLVGGNVVIEGGSQLSVPSGRIHLATTASPGEFAALPGESLANATSLQSIPNNPVNPALPASYTSYGLLSMASDSSINVSGTHTVVFLKGGQLVLSVNDATLNTSASTASQDTILLSSGSSIVTSNSGTDPGANVQLTVGTVKMAGAVVQTINSGNGDGGNISINATSVDLTNGTFVQTSTGLDFNTGTPVGSGNGGNVTVQGLGGAGSHADSFALSNSGISTQTVGPGNGGKVQLNASTLTMDSSSISTGTSGNDAGEGGGGVGGNVVLNVMTANILGGASILSQTKNFTSEEGRGRGGEVIIQGLQGEGSAAESVTLSGGSSLMTEVLAVSDGGQVTITSESLKMDGTGTTINSSVSADLGLEHVGQGGVVVNVQQANLSGGATIETKTISTQVGPGITVQGLQGNGSMADSVVLSGSGSGIITDSVGGPIRAGDVAVYAKSLTLAAGAVIRAATTSTTAAGGDVTIDAVKVDISGGSRILSQASDSPAGRIKITTNTFTLNNSSIATNTQGQGQAGNIDLNAGSVGLSNGALINSSSTGTGNAGNITITSASNVIMQNSSVTTEATQASGGDIEIIASDAGMVQLVNSNLLTSVHGPKGTSGGNITIDPQFVILQNSLIQAKAFEGNGGAISIVANVFLADPFSQQNISADSELGISGTVDIRAPVQNISGELVVLSQDFSSAAALLAQQCAARVADGTFSTFVVAAREGLPVEPGGFLPSSSFLTELGGSALSSQPPQFSHMAAAGLFSEHDARPLQLAKLGSGCRR